jgi:hypothetical protein
MVRIENRGCQTLFVVNGDNSYLSMDLKSTPNLNRIAKFYFSIINKFKGLRFTPGFNGIYFSVKSSALLTSLKNSSLYSSVLP